MKNRDRPNPWEWQDRAVDDVWRILRNWALVIGVVVTCVALLTGVFG